MMQPHRHATLILSERGLCTLYLTASSFAPVIITTATRGCHFRINVKMCCDKVLAQMSDAAVSPVKMAAVVSVCFV